jgi:hypothetical protein
MGEHDAFGHACGATGVDQRAAMPRFYLLHPLLHELGINSFPFDHEPVVRDDFICVFLRDIAGIVVYNN